MLHRIEVTFGANIKKNIALYESLSWFSKFLTVGADVKEEISRFKFKHDFVRNKIEKLYKIKSAIEFALDSDAAEVHLTEDDIDHIRKCCIVVVR